MFLKVLVLVRQVHLRTVLSLLVFYFMPLGITNITILNIYGVDYCCINFGIKEIEAVNLLQNTDLSKKSASFCKICFFF